MCIEYTVIGRNIRSKRDVKKLTQENVAEAIGMTPGSYGNLERGQRKVNLKRLAQLSILFEVPIESLVAGAVKMPDGSYLELDQTIGGMPEFLAAMAEIAMGCSEESLRLMLQLCRDVAQVDKSSSEKK